MEDRAQKERTYICIDLRSYYASVECVSRGLDPMTARLVVADPSRGRGTICLAVSPALKAMGVRNRCRVHEIPQGLNYIMATPRMRRYMEVSTEIFATYLRYVSAADVHVYSIDECFMDITGYLPLYRKTPASFARMLMSDVLSGTGIPSTCGIGPNLFLAKVALDVEAKHTRDGIAYMDQPAFFERMWHHRPLTDIWGIGHGIERRLARHGLFDLYDVAHANPQVLKREFGINGQLIRDHAWGVEPCTIKQIKDYIPRSTSISCGQVLMRDYSKAEGRVIMQEMAHEAVLEMISRESICRSVSVSVGYTFSPRAGSDAGGAAGDVGCGHGSSAARWLYGNRVGANRKITNATAAASVLVPKILEIYDQVTNPEVPVRRLSICLGGLLPAAAQEFQLFCDVEAMENERRLLSAIVAARKRFGKSAVMWGASLRECATGFERAKQIGGHRA